MYTYFRVEGRKILNVREIKPEGVEWNQVRVVSKESRGIVLEHLVSLLIQERDVAI
jgi:hypothetical protein